MIKGSSEYNEKIKEIAKEWNELWDEYELDATYVKNLWEKEIRDVFFSPYAVGRCTVEYIRLKETKTIIAQTWFGHYIFDDNEYNNKILSDIYNLDYENIRKENAEEYVKGVLSFLQEKIDIHVRELGIIDKDIFDTYIIDSLKEGKFENLKVLESLNSIIPNDNIIENISKCIKDTNDFIIDNNLFHSATEINNIKDLEKYAILNSETGKKSYFFSQNVVWKLKDDNAIDIVVDGNLSIMGNARFSNVKAKRLNIEKYKECYIENKLEASFIDGKRATVICDKIIADEICLGKIKAVSLLDRTNILNFYRAQNFPYKIKDDYIKNWTNAKKDIEHYIKAKKINVSSIGEGDDSFSARFKMVDNGKEEIWTDCWNYNRGEPDQYCSGKYNAYYLKDNLTGEILEEYEYYDDENIYYVDDNSYFEEELMERNFDYHIVCDTFLPVNANTKDLYGYFMEVDCFSTHDIEAEEIICEKMICSSVKAKSINAETILCIENSPKVFVQTKNNIDSKTPFVDVDEICCESLYTPKLEANNVTIIGHDNKGCNAAIDQAKVKNNFLVNGNLNSYCYEQLDSFRFSDDFKNIYDVEFLHVSGNIEIYGDLRVKEATINGDANLSYSNCKADNFFLVGGKTAMKNYTCLFGNSEVNMKTPSKATSQEKEISKLNFQNMINQVRGK